MPLGLNRSDLNKGGGTSLHGNPVTLPKNFGNQVNWSPSPAHFGNPIPTSGTEQNVVNWSPSPAHFGNINPLNPSSGASYILQADGTSHILLADLSGALLVS
jgi:hypothetical protein